MAVEQKVAIITGASQGIGAALVEAYLARNYQVVATSLSIGPSSNRNVLNIAGDIGEKATCERVVAEGLARFGRIDTLVNNAGVFVSSPFTHYTAEQYARVVATNLSGFFFVSQFAIEAMERQKRGLIINVSTSLVNHANSKIPSVLASLTKGGLDAATKSLAIEYANRGIRVNAVALGIIKTPMNPPETHRGLAAFHPLGRMGEISDVVNAILYLETADFVTGEILHVDGGQSAGH